MMTGCASSTKVSPISVECPAVSHTKISPPSDFSLLPLSTPVKYSNGNITRMDIINNQTKNNILWASDRKKAEELQKYITTLQKDGEIGQ